MYSKDILVSFTRYNLCRWTICVLLRKGGTLHSVVVSKIKSPGSSTRTTIPAKTVGIDGGGGRETAC